MGTEAFWVPAIISALGAGATAYTTKHAADKQDAEAARGINQQSRRQAEADARIDAELGDLKASNPDAERQASLDGFLQQLRAARGQASGGAPVPGASDRYAADKASSEAAIQNYGQGRAGTLSRIAGAQRQRQGEGQRIGRMGVDVEGIARNAQADDFLTKLRINGIRPNPWGIAAGQLAQGVASGMAGSYGAADDAAVANMSRTGYDPVKTGFVKPQTPTIPRSGPFY